jgi:conjugal transfer pilus assembly protein TraB
MGKNGVKGEVVMRNGKILGWAWGQVLLTGLVRAWSGLRSRLLAWVQRHPLAPVMF